MHGSTLISIYNISLIFICAYIEEEASCKMEGLIYIYIYILEWTRALNARSQLATCEVTAAFVDSKRLFVSMWNRVG